MKRIVLHIDSLVLNGYRRYGRHGIAEGLKNELGRLFSTPQAAQQLMASGNIARLNIGKVKIGQHANPQRIGAQVAQGIGKRVKP